MRIGIKLTAECDFVPLYSQHETQTQKILDLKFLFMMFYYIENKPKANDLKQKEDKKE